MKLNHFYLQIISKQINVIYWLGLACGMGSRKQKGCKQKIKNILFAWIRV